MVDKAKIGELRSSWADAQNEGLRDAKIPPRVDHRSLADQCAISIERAKELSARGDDAAAQTELDRAETLMRVPQTHLGPAVWNMEKRAIEKARKLGIPYEPVTDRLREALEDGTAPSVFVEAYRESRK